MLCMNTVIALVVHLDDTLVFRTSSVALPGDLPTLSWLSDTEIMIQFRNGEEEEVEENIILKQTSSIPGEVTPCLFDGVLASGEEAVISVSGCRDDSETLVSMSYKTMLIDLVLKDGVTKKLDHDYTPNISEAKEDISLQAPRDPVLDWSSDQPFTGPMPKGVDVHTKILYDRNLLEHFGNNHNKTKDWLNRVLQLSKPELQHSSLNTKINLIVDAILYKDIRIQADDQSLKSSEFTRVNENERTLIGAFTYSGLLGGRVGVAMIGTACRTDGFGTMITELWREDNSEYHSSRTYVHQLGHSLGML